MRESTSGNCPFGRQLIPAKRHLSARTVPVIPHDLHWKRKIGKNLPTLSELELDLLSTSNRHIFMRTWTYPPPRDGGRLLSSVTEINGGTPQWLKSGYTMHRRASGICFGR